MNEDINQDEESEWFEPLDPTSSMGSTRFLGTLMQPEKRVLLFIGLILITFFGGLSAGAFEPARATDEPAENEVATTTDQPAAIKASQALRQHLASRSVPKTESSNVADETSPKESAPSTLSEEKEKDDETKDETNEGEETPPKEPVVIDLKEVLELGNEALANKEWAEAAEQLELASTAWKKKRRGKAWRTMRYNLAKAHYKNKTSTRSVTILEALRESDPTWDKPLLLLGLAAKNAEVHAKAVKYLSLYLEKGGSKTTKVCPYLEEQDAVDNGSSDVQEACADEE